MTACARCGVTHPTGPPTDAELDEWAAEDPYNSILMRKRFPLLIAEVRRSREAEERQSRARSEDIAHLRHAHDESERQLRQWQDRTAEVEAEVERLRGQLDRFEELVRMQTQVDGLPPRQRDLLIAEVRAALGAEEAWKLLAKTYNQENIELRAEVERLRGALWRAPEDWLKADDEAWFALTGERIDNNERNPA